MKNLIQSVLFTYGLIFYSINLFAPLPAMVAGQKLPSLAPLVDKASLPRLIFQFQAIRTISKICLI